VERSVQRRWHARGHGVLQQHRVCLAVFRTTSDLVGNAQKAVPRCLTRAQREAAFLDPEPPVWCIEMEKWPYHTPAWKQWLADIRAGKKPPMPVDR
jgi:hypothetical protein